MCTGVLTFDSRKKATYNRIREHLEYTYHRKISVARNRNRYYTADYKGVAHVTSRRAYN